MPSVEVSCGTIRYDDYGVGMPLVLLHANPGDSQDFEAVIPSLARHCRVIALDWPGYGQSRLSEKPGSATVTLFYNALCEFISALALPPVVFIGNSVGGNVAARLAIEHPEKVRGLVLVAPGGFTPHNFITRTFCNFQGSRFSMSPALFANLYLRRRTPAVLAMLERASTIQSSPERRALNRALWRNFGQPESDLRASAPSIRAPTLLIFGKYDPAISAKKDGHVAVRVIEHARRVILPCGHAPFAEVPELFLAEVETFLNAC